MLFQSDPTKYHMGHGQILNPERTQCCYAIVVMFAGDDVVQRESFGTRDDDKVPRE